MRIRSFGIDVEDLADRHDVGVDVEVGQDHPLGVSLAAAAEDQSHGIAHRDRPRRPRGLLEQPDRRQASQGQGKGPVDPANRGADVLDPDHLHAVGKLEAGLLDERSAGEEGPQTGLGRRRAHRGLARGEVEIDHDPSRERRRQVRQASRHARRQHDPHDRSDLARTA